MSPLLFWIFVRDACSASARASWSECAIRWRARCVWSCRSSGWRRCSSSLDAFFIGVIQVLVYAGAVMVLFLFIIMLLDLKAEQRRKLELGRVRRRRRSSPRSSSCELVGVLDRLSRRGRSPFPALATGTHRRRSEQSGIAPLHRLQPAVPGRRHAPAGRDDRRGGPQQKRTESRTAMVTLNDYLLVSGLLFAIGFAGVLLRRNIIIIFMCLELMLNAANLSLVAFSRFNLVRRTAELQRRRCSCSSSSPSRPRKWRSGSRSSSPSTAHGRRCTSRTSTA